MLLDPSQALVDGVVEGRQGWVVDTVRVLIREQLEGAKPDVRCIEDVLAVYTLGAIKGRATPLINGIVRLSLVNGSCGQNSSSQR